MNDSSQTRPVAAPLPVDLVDKVEQGQYVLFVGSGASQPEPGYVGPPGRAILAAELIQRLGFAPQGATLPRVAAAYQDRASRQELLDYVARRHDDARYRPTATQALIAALEPRVVVSTSYDELLDGLLLRWPGRRTVLRNDDAAGLSHPQLIKLLGTASQPQTLRLTQEDQWTLFEDLKGVETTLRALSQDHPLLFVGLHPEDSAFRDLFAEFLYRLHERQTAPVSYLVHPRPRPEEQDYWRRRHLIILDAEPECFLQALRAELARRQGNVPPPLPALESPPPLDHEEAQRLDAMLQQVLALMGLGDPVMDETHFLFLSASEGFLHQLQDEYEHSGRMEVEVAGPDGAATAQARLRLQLGYAEWAQRNYGQARKYLEEARTLDPTLIDAYLALHYVQAERGDLEGALAAYRQMLERDPGQALLPARYQVEAVEGSGPLGLNYVARDRQEEGLVAATVLRSSVSRDPEALRAFTAALERLEHPLIPRLLRVEHYLGRQAVIFDHADGHPLIEGLNGSPLPAPQAFTVLNQVAGALAYAHLQGVPHLRLSPQVILTDGDDVVRVTGFGEGLLLEGSSRSADRRQTQDYLAPEQLAGAAGDAASDIYALGTVAYRLFTGRTPGTSTYDRPSELNPQVDEAVDVLVGRARAIDPARRFQDVGQMRQEMQRIARADRPGGFSQTVRWVLGLASQGMHWLTETRFRRLALTTLVLLALSAELWLAWPPGRGLTRSLVLLALICIPASLLCDWRVRDIARQMGYGSLIHSGRGMGVVLGALATVWLVVKLTVYGQPIFVGEPAPADFWSAYLVAPILTFAMTYLMLTTAHALGQLAERRSGRYAIGFYAGFLSWCVLVVLLIVLPIPSPLTLAS